MGTPREAKAAKYFVALLSSTRDILTHVESDLVRTMSEIDGRSEAMPWTASKFYEQEMGSGLLRRLLSFSALALPERLADVKLETQKIEDRYRETVSGGRRVNLDPGYLDAYKVVLASTKNAGQRIYLHAGIYGEATLLYYDGAFHGLQYTYKDYLWPETLAFFEQLRAAYLAQLKQLG
ncbi:MAG TPA: DUF4416 family protein [Candidatus Binatia bacterium]